MADDILSRSGAGAERGVATASTLGGLAALFSAAACCVLPLAFAALGIGAGSLAAVVPYHWSLTVAAGLAVAVGWALYIRRRRACTAGGSCAARPTRTTFILLCVATLFVALSAVWKTFFEAPLMAWFAGA